MTPTCSDCGREQGNGYVIYQCEECLKDVCSECSENDPANCMVVLCLICFEGEP